LPAFTIIAEIARSQTKLTRSPISRDSGDPGALVAPTNPAFFDPRLSAFIRGKFLFFNSGDLWQSWQFWQSRRPPNGKTQRPDLRPLRLVYWSSRINR